MLSFKSHRPDDKDFSYPTNDEDHCTNLFEQYLNQDPIELNDAVDNSDGLQAFDFAFDEETESSESCSADSKYSSSQPTQYQPLASFSSAPLQEPLPVRLRPKFVSVDAPGRSISSSELLNLEGRGDHRDRAAKVPSTSALASAVPTLRRKGKFFAPAKGTIHNRFHRMTKTPSADMIRPSYHHENSYNEWAQRFEDISIQSPTANVPSSPSRNTGTYRDKRPTKITTNFEQNLPQRQNQQGISQSLAENVPILSHGTAPQNVQFNHPATAPLPQEWQNQGLPEPSPLSSTEYSFGRPHLERSQTTQHLRHPSSWDNGFVSPLTPDFVAPGQVQPHWLHSLHSNSQSYNENGNSFQSAPAIATDPSQDFTGQDLNNFQYEPYAQFVNEDPSSDYAVLSPDQFFAPSTDLLTTPLPETAKGPGHSTANNNNNSSTFLGTPPHRSNSVSPHLQTSNHNTSTKTKTPTKTPHHRSKSIYASTATTPTGPSSRRQKSLSTLKSPRSATHLKHPRSASTLSLKSPRSASSITNPHPLHHPSNPTNGGASFGFVNFTEADKGKILTGVAPSGSSKTKARREQEAIEKKRKLSLAALRAIEEAGGDVESLRGLAEL